jgi:hypothetical protein
MWAAHMHSYRSPSLIAKELGRPSALVSATGHAAGIPSKQNHHGDSCCLLQFISSIPMLGL